MSNRKINTSFFHKGILLMFLSWNSSYSFGQEAKYSFEFNQMKIESILKQIESSAKYTFFYNNEIINQQVVLSLSIKDKTLPEILDVLSEKTNLDFKISGNVIYIKIKDNIPDERKSIKISGQVRDKNTGESIIGVSVVIKGTTSGTITDIDGKFSISVPNENTVLRFSYIGYEDFEIRVGKNSKLQIELTLKVSNLEGVTVIGYGTTLKRDFAGVSAKVSSDDIKQLPVVSPEQALQGLASGVQVSSASGTPGGGMKVSVRGQRSINSSNEPLYVVDGIPVNSSDIQNRNLGGESQNLLAGINPNDIESITVLKDASSTAIYGARAANGVVLIETKKGTTSQKTRTEVSYLYGVGKEVKRYEWLNADEYVTIINESRKNSNLPENDYGNYVNTNWQAPVFQQAMMQEVTASIQGGDAKTQFYISSGYRYENGVTINTGFERGSFRANIGHTVNDKLKLAFTFSVSRDNNRRQYNNWFGGYGPYASALFAPPVYPTHNADGSYYIIPEYGNPIANGLESRLLNTTTKMLSSLSFSYDITKKIKFKTAFSYDLNYLREDHFDGSQTAMSLLTVNPASLLNHGFYGNTELSTYSIEPTLNYDTDFSKIHKLSFLVGSTIQGHKYFLGRAYGDGLGASDLTTYLNTASVTTGYSTTSEYNFLSFFGRVGYSLKGKYIANLTLRRDGSSRFGPENRFGNFYAGSVAWNFSEENFIKNIPWLSMGKLRIGYGITGNDQIGDYMYQDNWSNTGSYLNLPGLSPNQIENPALSWEETGTLDVGLEYGFLKDRITGSIGYYISKTKDLLFAVPITGTSGFSSVTGNLGDIENKGIEIDASGFIFDNQDFKWQLGFNVAFVENKILALNTDKPIIQTLIPNAMIVGQAINTYYCLVYQGVNSVSGQAVFKDVNQDGVITTADKEIAGHANPDFYGGITNTFSYKNFTLRALVNFVGGNDLYNLTYWYAEGVDATYNKPRYVLDRWQKPGDITDVPKSLYGGNLSTQTSSRYLSPGDYLRLKNVTLSYNLPEKFVKKLRLDGISFYVTGTNLITLTRYEGIDPEVNAFNRSTGEINANTWAGIETMNIPQLKYFIFGTNIKL